MDLSSGLSGVALAKPEASAEGDVRGTRKNRPLLFASGNGLFIRSFDYLYCIGRVGTAFTPSAAFTAAAAR